MSVDTVLSNNFFQLVSGLYRCAYCDVSHNNPSKLKDDESCKNMEIHRQCCYKQYVRQSHIIPRDLHNEVKAYLLNVPSLSFLTRSIPKDYPELMTCYILKDKSKYKLYLETKDITLPEHQSNIFNNMARSNIENKQDILLLTAQASQNWKSNRYDISSSHFITGEPYPIATLKSNFLGTEYMLYRHNDENCKGTMTYTHYDHKGGPRQINAEFSKGVYKITNIQPTWHEDIQAHVLHFWNNRVKEKSVKNMKLVFHDDIKDKNHNTKTILQFGRTKDRTKFILDFKYPLSPIIAFALALSSIDCRL